MGGDAARQMKRMQTELREALPHLTSDNHREIIVRMPAKDVLRSGTVCKAWHHMTTEESFLADNADRQHLEVLLYKYVMCQRPRHEWQSSGRLSQELMLDAFIVSGDEKSRRSLIHYRKPQDGGWILLAVFEGVLLFKKADGMYILCNPTTRKWSDLPQDVPYQAPQPFNAMDDREFAFYFHQPSRQYRLLCRHGQFMNGRWCILSTGQAEPRNIDMEGVDDAEITAVLPCLRKALTVPLALHGSLHWPPHQGSVKDQTKIVVFNMLSEVFSQIEGPPTTTGHLVKLFDMEGLLVAADFGKESHIHLWFLENWGNAARWELRHRVVSPWGPYYYGRPLTPLCLTGVAATGDGEGNIMLGNCHGLVVYNVKNKALKVILSAGTSGGNEFVVSKHVFRANLVNHPHFSTRPDADFPFVHFE